MTGRKRKPRTSENRIAAVRGFNRFYTRQIGVLRKNFLDSPYSLGEARVLYEIARGRGATTATEIGRALDLDAGYLSRVLRSFERGGLIHRTASPSDARQSHLALSPRGKRAFAPLERRSQGDTAALLQKLEPADQARLIEAMNTIEALLGGEAAPTAPRPRTYKLRAPMPGDFGWIVSRHAELYAKEYGWTEPFEGLCAQIVADFANKNDPKRERCWIAEMDGENVGCIFLVKDSEDVARIRLLIVAPKARGLGLGARLVDECVNFARRAGYKKITLWTHSVLKAARHIYSESRVSSHPQRAPQQLGPPGGERTLGFGFVMPSFGAREARNPESYPRRANEPASKSGYRFCVRPARANDNLARNLDGRPVATQPGCVRAFGRRKCSSSRGMISTKLHGP